MNATLSQEPYQLPAGLLALAVHVVFFSLLYFGFTWQTQPVRTMRVELWRSLPEEVVAPKASAKVEEELKPLPPPQPQKAIVPDIALPEKKKTEPKPEEKQPDKKPVEVDKPKPVEPKVAEKKKDNSAAEKKAAQEQADREQAALDEAARERAEQDAAINAIVDEYKAKIINKIRRNIVKPPDVRDDARAEFRVTLLPDGSVLPPKLIRSSGNAAYDNAVERAIVKSQPLPLPPDVKLFNRFRVLMLVFRPVE